MGSRRSARTRYLGFGVLCLLLAVIAGVSSSWIPLVVLAVVGVVFVGRGLRVDKG
jgi:hypothetical protein